MRAWFTAGAVALGLVSVATEAQTVRYQFGGFGAGAGQVSLDFTNPGFLTANGGFMADFSGAQTNCQTALLGTCQSVDFTNLGIRGSNLTIGTSNGNAYIFPFRGGAFTQVGTFQTLLGGSPGQLVVSLVPSAVPEAATWAMMMVGLGVVGGSLRRRRKIAMRAAFA